MPDHLHVQRVLAGQVGADHIGHQRPHRAGGDDAVSFAPPHRAVFAGDLDQQGAVVGRIDGAVVGIDDVALGVHRQLAAGVQALRLRDTDVKSLHLSDAARFHAVSCLTFFVVY